MIDEEWLKGLHFEVPDLGTITGLAGVGSQFVALMCTKPDGTRTVVKSLRRQLAWHLNEVPRSLGWADGHDLGRVNRKLLAAAGSPTIDENSFMVNGVFNIALHDLLRRSPMEWLASTEDMPDPLAYLVQTDVFNRRVTDVLSSDDTSEWGNQGVELFGELFPIDTRAKLAHRWREVQALVDTPLLADLRANMAPDRISFHPLFVWGAAVVEDMIEPSEFEATAAFVKERFPEMHEPANPFPMQGSDWYDVFMMYVDAETRQRLAEFARHFGFVYQLEG